jgi:uncharacterized spore protein YtfJ
VQNAGGTLYFTSAGVSVFQADGVAASADAVAQVKSTTKLDTFSTSSSSFTDVTGMAQSITPTSASNKILIVVTMTIGANNGLCFFRLMRDSTAIGVGTAAGSRTSATTGIAVSDINVAQPLSMSFLDSPATTSATNYKVQVISPESTAIVVNSSYSDASSSNRVRAISTITVFEVAP